MNQCSCWRSKRIYSRSVTLVYLYRRFIRKFEIQCEIADDTSLFSVFDDVNTSAKS